MRQAGRSLGMRRKVATNLQTILNYAQSQGLVAQNVAREIKLKADARNAAEPLREGHDFPSRAELRTLIDKAPPAGGHHRHRGVHRDAGQRVARSQLGNVDLDQGVIHVRQRADAWSNLGAPKSAAGKRESRSPRWR